jgi:hypothetical protein
MSALAISCVVFACVFAGALLGLSLQGPLPDYHLSETTKDAVKLGTGLIATLAALVLGLLIASAKSAYDTQNSEIKQMSATILFLDRILAHYGPETKEARDRLRRTIAGAIERIWPENGSRPANLAPAERRAEVESFFDKIQELRPQNDVQHSLQAQAVQISTDLGKTRFLLFEQKGGGSYATPFLVVLVFWLTIIFATFGLFAPRNATVVAVWFVCALSVSGAIFLILEMDMPFEGLLQISSEPMRDALARIGQ